METPTTTSPPVLTIRRNNGHILKTDLTTIGPMLAYYRTRAGLTHTQLAMESLTASSATLRIIESGARGISNRNLALRLATVLKLTPHEIDHFLHVAGFSTVIDWQQFCRDILVDLGLGSVYEEQSDALYDVLSKQHARRARVPSSRASHDV